ncbi:MAG TPA: Rossmann-like and DUF2520 domain-containing protein [Candidatus Desulfaltia sp.]|nr:Rossmann-like and DUF2520 domain-containing protein [Candidatus Desulfaltia sp.]
MIDIAIIGAGRLGTSLGRALAEKGYTITALTCRRKASAAESRAIIGQGRALTDNAAAARMARVIFFCLPDEVIAGVTSRLARSRVDWSGKTVFHTSGLLPARVLEPLQERGASIASFHPVQAFPSKTQRPAHFRGISFGLEGDRNAVALAGAFVRRLGGRAVAIPEEAKPFYHAAFTFAGNFFVVLLDAATCLLKEAKIPEDKATGMLLPLLQGTLHNVKEFNTAAALTGPLVRGDAASVRSHLEALERWPRYAEVYRKLSLLGLEMAEKRGLKPQKLGALKNLLAGR